MHEVVKGKFFAFKGPTGKRKSLGFGRYTLVPRDYFDVFRSKNIRAVVRLNNREYDRAAIVQAGFNHYDLFFTDCSTPSDAIVDKFLRTSEQEQGGLAVHCLAGLGRTGTLIALWMMKHMYFTANESIAWLRIVRPGSVIGPQQQYLKDQEARMWALGEAKLPGLGLHSEGHAPRSPAGTPAPTAGAHASDDTSAALADMVTQGMLLRDQHRVDRGPDDDGGRGAQLLLPRKLSGARARPALPAPPGGPALAPAHRGSAQGATPGGIRRSNSWGDLAGTASSGENRLNGASVHGTPTRNTRIVSATRPDGAARSREAPFAFSASPRHVRDGQLPGRSGSASRDRVAVTDGAVPSGKLLPAKTSKGVRGQAAGVTCSADGLPQTLYSPAGKGLLTGTPTGKALMGACTPAGKGLMAAAAGRQRMPAR